MSSAPLNRCLLPAPVRAQPLVQQCPPLSHHSQQRVQELAEHVLVRSHWPQSDWNAHRTAALHNKQSILQVKFQL